MYANVQRGRHKTVQNAGAGGATHVQYGLRAQVANQNFQAETCLHTGDTSWPTSYNPQGAAETVEAQRAWLAHIEESEGLERSHVPGGEKQRALANIHQAAHLSVGGLGEFTSAVSTTIGHSVTTHTDGGAGPETIKFGTSTPPHTPTH